VTRITRLGLNKLFLWQEAERYQTYPRALARLREGQTYTRRQIAEELVGLAYEGGKDKPLRENQLKNLFGLVQIGQDKLLLKGINLFRRVTPQGRNDSLRPNLWESADDEWAPTEEALHLAEAYRQQPNGVRWQQLLAEQLVRYEPRTRVVVYLLSHGQHLQFEKKGFFVGNTQTAQLVGDTRYDLFADNCAAFNLVLCGNLDIAIGPWWRAEIERAGFELSEEFKLEGALKRPPSTNYLNSALKTALYVFYALDILIEDDDGWYIDTDAFAQNLSPELTRDLLGEAFVPPPDLSDDWIRLAHVVATLADERGFVVASEAANQWGELTGLPPNERWPAFDSLVRRGIFEDRVQLLERHLGQPRLGRGLFDDDNMRLIKLRVLT
jgi:hypothetical protein